MVEVPGLVPYSERIYGVGGVYGKVIIETSMLCDFAVMIAVRLGDVRLLLWVHVLPMYVLRRLPYFTYIFCMSRL